MKFRLGFSSALEVKKRILQKRATEKKSKAKYKERPFCREAKDLDTLHNSSIMKSLQILLHAY